MDKLKTQHLPSLPGVYLFKDENNEILYIGKAKSLKNRVRSYFAKNSDWKVQALLQEAHNIDFVLTNTEIEAMLLEAQLIGEHKPKFNVLLKSGQPFVYLMFSKQELPELKIVRNKKEKGIFFGPFLHKRQARSVAKFLIDTFKLQICNKKIANGCLDYHIGRCAGSCKDIFDSKDYLFRIELAKSALKKNRKNFLTRLHKKIKEHTKVLAFEKAKKLHQYVLDLDMIFNTLHVKYSHEKYAPSVFIAMHQTKRLPIDKEQLAQSLQELLQTNKPIRTIDCFDISHFQSSYLVGSCVRFSNGLPDKNNFRRFKIRSLQEQNDYAALHEIVSRRYKKPEDLPDLILIDGGKGQLNAVKDLFPNTLFASLAKREELLFTPLHPDGIHLDVKTPIGKTLIALRDYAHHFAISYHKLRRNKDIRN
ncbi:MAG: GIY-YIG nuclease family protein [Candidatus Dependentiae bacterium]